VGLADNNFKKLRWRYHRNRGHTAYKTENVSTTQQWDAFA